MEIKTLEVTNSHAQHHFYFRMYPTIQFRFVQKTQPSCFTK